MGIHAFALCQHPVPVCQCMHIQIPHCPTLSQSTHRCPYPLISNGYPWICRLSQSTLKTGFHTVPVCLEGCLRSKIVLGFHTVPVTQGCQCHKYPMGIHCPSPTEKLAYDFFRIHEEAFFQILLSASRLAPGHSCKVHVVKAFQSGEGVEAEFSVYELSKALSIVVWLIIDGTGCGMGSLSHFATMNTDGRLVIPCVASSIDTWVN